VGIRSASLSFSDAARRSQNTVTLSGTGTGAGVSLSPAAIVFPTQIIGASTAQTVTLTNPGTLTLALNSIAVQANSGGVFTQTNTCGPTLQPESQCAIDVTYTSAGPGSATAILQVTDNALDSPQAVSLTGSGAVPVPLINQPLEPASIAPGEPEFTLTVTGTGFAPSATVNWNGTALATTYVSSEKLQASVPAANIASRSSAAVTVANPGPALVSNAILFPVEPYLAAPTFANAPGSPIAAGTQPESVVVADFRGIGRSDLAVANVVSDNVTILLSNGDGTFTQGASSPIPVGVFPGPIVVGDFNGDGKLDLVTANIASENLTILLGNGNGTFTPLAKSPAAGIEPVQVVTGDFNADGKLDLAVANASSNGVRILLGNGDGTFTPVPAVSATGSSPVGIAIGDFNGDGKLDLAVANEYSNSVTVLLGNGDGTFMAAASPTAGTNPIAIAAGDFNGDGKLDLAVANAGSNNLTVLLGKGDGTFLAAASPAAGVSPWGIAEADFNGDGKLDLAVANATSNNVSILLGNGDGTFTPSASSPGTGQNPGQIAIGDFNGDGQLDLATGNSGANSISVLLQQRPALWASVSPATLTFGNQDVGTKSAAQNITLSNSGTAALTINSIAIGGTNLGDFTQTNTCGSSVASGGSCTISVTFTPTAAGTRSASVSVSDNASGSPQTVPLSGTGASPDFTIQASTLSPSSIIVGQSGISTITITSVNGFSSAVSLTCSGLPVEAVCSFSPNSVIPISNGTATATATITTSTSTPTGNSNVTITGTAESNSHSTPLALTVQAAPDFTVSAGTVTPNTVSAGQSATSTISITSENGFNGAVSLTCSVSPTPSLASGCSFSSNSVTPSANGTVTSTLSISTTAATASLTRPSSANGSNLFCALAVPVPGILMLGAAVRSRSRKRKLLGFLAGFLFLAVITSLSGCGGGGGSHNNGNPGTPAGSYTITVNASGGSSIIHSTTVTLTVQ